MRLVQLEVSVGKHLVVIGTAEGETHIDRPDPALRRSGRRDSLEGDDVLDE
jgi:hypothetical protein